MQVRRDRLLAIDVGNTSVDFCLFKDGRMSGRTRLTTGKDWKAFTRKIRPYRNRILGCVVSSVVPAVMPSLKRALAREIRVTPHVIGENIRVPISNRYRKPKQVGSDRLVNALAGFTTYGGPLLIIDFGTALTFDLINRRGDYLGGVIMPGPQIWLDSLAERTALLPRMVLHDPIRKTPALPGRTTEESVRAGALFGYAVLCEGMITHFKKQYGRRVRVMACGGQAKMIARYCKQIRYVDDTLTLRGLYLTYTKRVIR